MESKKIYTYSSNKKQKKHLKVLNSQGPSEKVTKYTGPFLPIGAKNEVQTLVLLQAQAFDLITSGAGVINTTYGSWPSGTSNWSSLSTTWHEARTLSFEMLFYPQNRYNKTTTTTRPLVTLIDHEDAATVGSYVSAASHNSMQLHSLEDPFRTIAKMDGVEESVFQDTGVSASTGNRFYIKLYSDGNSLSTTFGVVILRYLVQVRGKKA